ncbi:MAG: hypothetical protein MJ160_02145 [Treponema sp.]|nr:hypothetical protein [Treponema sp.]
MKKYKDLCDYDFSDYAEEITGDALFKINGGAEVQNSHEGVANAQVGDTITRNDGTVVTFDNEKKWEEAFEGKVDVVGWKWQTSKYETKKFNNSGWFDRQSNNLMDYCKGIIDEK